MRDDDIERLLAAAQPAGPPPELRARILSRLPRRRAWPWAVAAAAALMATTLLQTGASAARDRVRTDASGPPDIEAELVSALRETFNFSDSEARLIAMAQQVQMRIERNRAAVERLER
jgi:hypothetical protein